ncbi:MAG TPA: carbohydrate ABC transporter permease [Microvirga sp.]|jgi:ABC-type glycerol-3-phosphate transport system permease component|nr:carbohydrate ABC transporter permease [Microvirga sp.]
MAARRSTARISDWITYGALVCASLFALLPLLWGLSTSLKPPTEVSAWPPTWIPHTPTLENYAAVLANPKYVRYLLNTLGVTFVVMLLGIGLAAHASWVVARTRFRGKSAMMFLMWATVMIPGVSIIVPMYLLSVDLGLYDTYTVLVIVYCASVVPTLVWLLRGFVASIPQELEESALIDGSSRAGVFYRIVVPLMRPGFGAAAVLVFVTVWNEFLIGYALVLGDEHRLIQVGVYYFVTDVGIEWGPLMAGMIISALPIVILFAALQRYFIQGLTGGAVKG